MPEQSEAHSSERINFFQMRQPGDLVQVWENGDSRLGVIVHVSSSFYVFHRDVEVAILRIKDGGDLYLAERMSVRWNDAEHTIPFRKVHQAVMFAYKHNEVPWWVRFLPYAYQAKPYSLRINKKPHKETEFMCTQASYRVEGVQHVAGPLITFCDDGGYARVSFGNLAYGRMSDWEELT